MEPSHICDDKVVQSDCLVGEMFTAEASYRFTGLCPVNTSVLTPEECLRHGRRLGGNPSAVLEYVVYYHRPTGCYAISDSNVVREGHPTINWNTALTDIPANPIRKLVCTLPGCTPCPVLKFTYGMTTDGPGQSTCDIKCQGDVGGGCDYRDQFGTQSFWSRFVYVQLALLPFFICSICFCSFCCFKRFGIRTAGRPRSSTSTNAAEKDTRDDGQRSSEAHGSSDGIIEITTIAAYSTTDDNGQQQHFKPLPEGCQYHFFICKHEQLGATGAMNIYYELSRLGYKVWISNGVEGPNLRGMLNAVRSSACFLMFLTHGIFTRPWCVHVELYEAVLLRKTILLVRSVKGQGKYQLNAEETSSSTPKEWFGLNSTVHPRAEPVVQCLLAELEVIDWSLNAMVRPAIIGRLVRDYERREEISRDLHSSISDEIIEVWGKETASHRGTAAISHQRMQHTT